MTDRATDYAERVCAGEIIAGPHVRNACRRHLDDLDRGEDRGLWFDEDEAAKAIAFFEEVLTLSEGQFEGRPFLLHESQAFKIGALFGWKQEDGRRRFRRAYIEEGKGNGKSPLAAGIGLKGLLAEGEAGAQVYSAGAKRDQAAILFQDAVKMVRRSPALARRCRVSGAAGREYNIAHVPSGSFFRPVSRDTGRTGSGPRPFVVLADEIHELPDRSILETLERGFKFRLEPLLVAITNSGSDRNSVCWEEHEHAVKVAAGSHDAVTDFTYVGEPVDDQTFSYVCALDEGDDPLTDPTCWVKANPLLGVTITEEYLAGVVSQARAIPGKLNGILRLHFCVWTDAERAWMSRGVVEDSLADFDPVVEHGGQSVFVGIDLSQSRDLTVGACAVETGEHDGKPTFDAWIEAWTPGDTLAARALRDKAPYEVWVRDGFLNAPAGKTISFRQVAQWLAEVSRDFDIKLAAYDSYAFRRFEEEVVELGIEVPFIMHPQGGTKRGARIDGLDEGLWSPSSLRELENALLEGRIRLRGNPVLISAIMSAVTEEDRWGNRWLAKERSLNKIDAAVALMMAIGAAVAGRTMQPTRSVYETRGLLMLG